MRIPVPVLLIAALLTGCAGNAMEGIMNSWQGAHINAVIDRWGYPTAERRIAGRKLYVWTSSKTLLLPGAATSKVNVIGDTAYVTTEAYGGGAANFSCTRTLEVNRSDIVVGWQWEGNDCPMTEIGRFTHWRNPNAAATAGTVRSATIPDTTIDLADFRDVAPYPVHTLFPCQVLDKPGFGGEAVAALTADVTVEVTRESPHWLAVKLSDGRGGFVGRTWVAR